MGPEAHAPKDFDPTHASPAGVYDYLLGGTANFAPDRQQAEAVRRRWPDMGDNPRVNRDFLIRVVKALTDAGVDQFLDLGSGLPTEENVHQVAQRAVPDARVIYVDNDSRVPAHGRALLGDQTNVQYVESDLRDVDAVVSGAQQLLDFDRPIALLIVSVLHFLDDEAKPTDLVGRYLSHLPPGSYLGLSHAASDGVPADLQRAMDEVFRGFHMRTRDQILDLFHGLEMLDPGLVDVQRWRADPEAPLFAMRLYGGVALKR